MLVYNTDDKVKLFCGDFLNVELEESSIDLVVTSPPYNVGIDYKKFEDSMSYEEYLEWTNLWLKKV